MTAVMADRAGYQHPRIGSLFSGYGGLDMGVQAVTGGDMAWHVEFDDAPSRILEHRFPGVPNYGDITAVDWAAVEPVDVLTGGFPCQDLSLAGRRAGMRPGTRSGLWADFLKAIDALRPELAVIENVRGLLSGCAESEADSDRGPCPRCADPKSGVGHAPNIRALGRVLIDLASIGYDARWVGLRAADAGAPHLRFRVFVIAHPAGQSWSVGDGDDVRARSTAVGREPSTRRGRVAENADRATRDQRRFAASDEAESRWTRPNAGGRGGASTPNTAGRGRDWWPQDEVGEALERVAPAGRRGGSHAASDARSARLGEQSGGAPAEEAGAHGGDLAAGDRGSRPAQDWGPYRSAVERWERRLGRRAPNPTRPDGKNGANRLNPALVEWMMGLPEGWVTAPEIGLTRAQQLKALGNGVVPQQAALAVATLLEAEEVAA